MGVNFSIITGVVKSIQVSTPKDPKKNPSAVIVLQYGAQRDTTGGQVEFVNALTVRIPSYRFPRYADRLAVGQEIVVHGRSQGVLKRVMNEAFIVNETIADRIDFRTAPNVDGVEAPAQVMDTDGVNVSVVSGVIKSIQVSTPKNASKSPSAVVVIQYGPQRDTTGGQVEFVNALSVRIPSYRYPRYADRLAVGQEVVIYGRGQGVLKRVMNEAFIVNETVADRVDFENAAEPHEAAAADATD